MYFLIITVFGLSRAASVECYALQNSRASLPSQQTSTADLEEASEDRKQSRLPNLVLTQTERRLLQSKGKWGAVEGQIIFDGPLPSQTLLVQKDTSVKDAESCAKSDIPDDSLQVDSKTRGLANCFVYIRRAPTQIHPALRDANQPVELTVRGCRYSPRCLTLQTDQTLRIVCEDKCLHNPHFFFVRNHVPSLLGSKTSGPSEYEFPRAEVLPTFIKCDIHRWMSASILILDHPYMTVTDKDGQFRITGLPEGDHELRIWHERCGYIFRRVETRVEKAKVTSLGDLHVSHSRFEEGED